jgi:hypothetical protein
VVLQNLVFWKGLVSCSIAQLTLDDDLSTDLTQPDTATSVRHEDLGASQECWWRKASGGSGSAQVSSLTM